MARKDSTRTVGLTKQPGGPGAAARKRAALEMIAREGPSLKRTARRYSICAEDAEDAYQRALEIVLTKAPTDQPQELIRWTQVVTKHEALAIRRKRERLLGTPARRPEHGEDNADWLAMIPATGSGPDEAVELRERIARSREALRALKPAELRALTLLAEGYSYAEIGEITGFSQTKVNRCLAEGRERFRRLVSRSEDGSHCREMAPLLSAFCDGEASAEDAEAVREHLRACASCRATMRSYRATAAAAALVPLLPESRSLLERAQEVGAWWNSRFPGTGAATDSGVGQVVAAGGSRGTGFAGLAKLLAICAGTAGGAAACVAAGVVPAPFDALPHDSRAPTIERVSRSVIEQRAATFEQHPPAPEPEPKPKAKAPTREEQPEASAAVETAAVEYSEPSPAPAPEPAPEPEPSSSSSASAAGEFGP